MTRQALAMALILVAFAFEALGQTQAAKDKPAKDPTEEQNLDTYASLLRQDLNKQKVAIISEMMNFTPEEASKFWPIYSKYSQELQQIGDEKYAGIKEFAAAWPKLNDAKCDELANKVLDLEARTTELKKKYYAQFKEAVSAKAAAKFLQIENQLLGLLNLQISARLPLVE